MWTGIGIIAPASTEKRLNHGLLWPGRSFGLSPPDPDLLLLSEWVISIARVWMAQRIWVSYEYSPTILRRRSVVEMLPLNLEGPMDEKEQGSPQM